MLPYAFNECFVSDGNAIRYRGRSYVRGLSRHSVPDCMFHNPVFTARSCTIVDFKAPYVLDAFVSVVSLRSRLHSYLYFAGTLMSDVTYSLRVARASCMRNVMTRIQFLGLLLWFRCDVHR